MILELEPLDDEARNRQPADFEPKPSKTKYSGPEHRCGPRRLKVDRREMLRFELDKIDRRSDVDRRSGSKWNNMYSL